MYTDEELANVRFEISRPLEAILRQIDPATTAADKDKMWELYEALDQQRNKLSDVVWNMPRAGIWSAAFTTAYNAVDEGAQYFAFAQGGNEDDRPGHLATCEQHLYRAVESLTMA